VSVLGRRAPRGSAASTRAVFHGLDGHGIASGDARSARKTLSGAPAPRSLRSLPQGRSAAFPRAVSDSQIAIKRTATAQQGVLTMPIRAFTIPIRAFTIALYREIVRQLGEELHLITTRTRRPHWRRPILAQESPVRARPGQPVAATPCFVVRPSR